MPLARTGVGSSSAINAVVEELNRPKHAATHITLMKNPGPGSGAAVAKSGAPLEPQADEERDEAEWPGDEERDPPRAGHHVGFAEAVGQPVRYEPTDQQAADGQHLDPTGRERAAALVRPLGEQAAHRT